MSTYANFFIAVSELLKEISVKIQVVIKFGVTKRNQGGGGGVNVKAGICREEDVIVLLTSLSPLASGISSFGVGAVNNDKHQEHEKHNLHVCREAEEQWKENLSK